MLLVVVGDHVRLDLLGSLASDHDVVTMTTIPAARERCQRRDVDAVLVDRDFDDPAAARFVRDLRRDDAGQSRMPVVAIVDGPAPGLEVEEYLRTPVDADALCTAVRRAVRIGEYEEAIGQLFAACSRGSGPQTPNCGPASPPAGEDLWSARRRADECLRALDACDGRLPVERLLGA